MNERNLWDSINHPTGLVDMVHVGWVQRLLRSADWMGFPGPEPDLVVDGQTRVEAHARRVFDKFVELGIEYVAEPTDSEPGAQRIRPVNEVLKFGKATCVDLCVAFCCAALDAGIYPLILTVTADGAQRRHAIVLVPMERQWAMGCDVLIEEGFSREPMLPNREDLRDLLVEFVGDSGGSWLAIDVEQVTEPGAGWGVALSRGAAYIRDWDWDVLVDIGGLRSRTPDRVLPPGGHIEKVLAPAYAALPEDFTPLQLIKARHGVVPYQQRTEMRQLREWAMTVPSDSRTGRNGRNADISVAVVTGAGGSGKTRMAAQLCHDLSKIGWYTGFLPSTTEVTDEELAALAAVTTELLVVVDYAEEARRGLIARVVRKLRARESATRIVLTARGAETWWEEFYEEAEQDGTVLSNTLSLSIRGKQQVERDPWFFGRMYRRAVQRFSYDLNGVVPTDVEVPESLGDTALDVVLRAWLAVYAEQDGAGRGTLTRGGLYDRVLSVEFAQWRKTPILTEISTSHMRRAAATLSLLAPSRDEDVIDDVLSRLPEWNREHLLRSRFAELLVQSLLRDDGAEAVSLRPDPVAEHLILEVFGKNPDLLDRVLPQDPAQVPGLDDPDAEDSVVTRVLEMGQQARNACVTLTRASSLDREVALRLARRALRERPFLWKEALDVALTQGGPLGPALEALIESDIDLPLSEIVDAIPFGHAALARAALAGTKRLAESAEHSTERQAHWANSLAVRLSDVGERAAALESAREAVYLYGVLVEKSPNDYKIDLAAALDNLAVCLSGLGEINEALDAAQEAVNLYRNFVSESPDENRRDLAISLSNLANYRLAVGELSEALDVAQEAVDLCQSLASESPEKYELQLVSALVSLVNCLASQGEVGRSLEVACEAESIMRELFAESRASYTVPLAKLLDTLTNCLLELGDYPRALKVALEAERLNRWLVKESPVAFTPNLAVSLNTLAICLLEDREYNKAMSASCEAVALYRVLYEGYPQLYATGLATSLNTRANCLSGLGRLGEALDVAQESLNLYRDMCRDNPIEYESRLAMSLSNLARHLWRVNRREKALDAAREAVDLRRELAKKYPAAFNPDLAASLNGLAIRLSGVGKLSEALTTAREAVELYRALAHESPDIYKPKLAVSLNSLANRLVENGDRGGASEAFHEGVCLYRKLVEESSDMYKPELAMMINNMAENLSSIGDNEGALRSVLEGVDLYRGLTKESLDHYRPDLARALNSMACGWLGVGNSNAALDACCEAVDLYRSLVEVSPAVYNANLAEALNTCANILAERGELKEALDACCEAVDLYRSLVEVSPAVYNANLAEALNTRAYIASVMEDRRGALDASQEALDLYRGLAQVSPEAYTVNLAWTLNNHANSSLDMGEEGRALKSAFEAADLFRMLVLKDRVSHCENLAGVLQNLARILAMSDRLEEALGVFVKDFNKFSPGVRACLLVARATGRGDGQEVQDVVAAAREADSTDDPALLGPVRRMIARVITDAGISDTGLPRWATVDAEPVVSRIEGWLECEDSEQRVAFLEARWSSPSALERKALAALAELDVDRPPVAELAALVERIADEGIQAVTSDLRIHYRVRLLARDWYEAHVNGRGVSFLREHTRGKVDALSNEGQIGEGGKQESGEWEKDLGDPDMRIRVLQVLAAMLTEAEAASMESVLALAELTDPSTAYDAHGSDEGAEDTLRELLEARNWRAMVTVLGVRPSVVESTCGRIARLLSAAVNDEPVERLRELYEHANEEMDAIDRRHLQTLLDQALRTRQCPATFADILAWIKHSNLQTR